MRALKFDPQAAHGIGDLEDLLRVEREKEKDVVVDKDASVVSLSHTTCLCIQCWKLCSHSRRRKISLH